MNASSKILPLLFQAVIEGQHVGETLAPAVGAEGHVKLQGQLCCTFCDLGRHYRDFWRGKSIAFCM